LYLAEQILDLRDFLKKYHFGKPRDYPAFFRLLTKKSFSLVSKSNFDFLSFSLISVVGFFLILLFISPDSNNRLLLSISTLILTYTQIKSGKRFIGSLGWSVTFLSIGLIFGGLLENNSFIQEVSNNSLSIQKIQSIPAMFILWLGVIFL